MLRWRFNWMSCRCDAAAAAVRGIASSTTPLLNCRGAAEDDGALAGECAAIAMRDRHVAFLDLSRAAFAPHLTYGFDQQLQPVHARMTIGEPAAIGIDRQAAA